VIGLPRDGAGARALALFDDAPPGDRFHVRTRWRTCPFAAVERAVPRHGRVLEVGCGHGLLSLYLGLSSPHREVLGVDIDAGKIDLAANAAARLDGDEAHVRFAKVEPDGFADGSFDAIVIADVLYLLPAAARATLLERAAQHLVAGGRLVVKEAGVRPRWKATLTVAQELLATRVLRITEGEQVEFVAPEELAAVLRAQGLDTTVRRVDRGYLHPHVLLEAAAPR
jgi:SAM-dependent methyltransferase